MIPYEQLAAALERRASPEQAPAEDNTLSSPPADNSSEYLIGDVLTDEEAGG
jgi:hypothetical protein